ncbi:MAG: DUF4388 domain-containing protein [Holophagaceae bacterium]|nr:DUF4388 domain-containing protein [Holophagaceae bacterium]
MLGKILVNRNLISEAEIRRMVQTKTEESIYDTSLGRGDFRIPDNRLPDQKTMLISLEVTGIVLEGARRMDEWEGHPPDHQGRGCSAGAGFGSHRQNMLPLSPEDADVLFRLDERKTIAQLMQELRRSEFILSKHLHGNARARHLADHRSGRAPE